MSIYTIHKKSGTYSELLETYGLANFLHKIFETVNMSDTDIVITDREYCFEVSTSVDITDEIISKLKYFPPFKYIKQKVDSDVSQYPDYYDYPTQYAWKKEQQDLLKKACTIKEPKEKRNEIERINNIFETEKSRDIEYDVYSQIQVPNNFSGFDKLYSNFYANREKYPVLVKYILDFYQCNNVKMPKDLMIAEANTTALQLYNPNQGKGLKAAKANSVAGSNFKLPWISEAMKISGALTDMICQLVKVGGNYDMKVFVPEYKQLNFVNKHKIIPSLKKYSKGNTPIKIDVLCTLLLARLLVENTPFAGRRRKIKDIVAGLHSVYQKDLGQNKAVMNIGFIQLPEFIEIGSKDDVQNWIEIIDGQRSIIGKMDEDKGAVQGLLMYRNFISSSNLNDFFKFSFWYAEYLMNQFSKQKRPGIFTFKTLNKFYTSMDNQDFNLKDIIENEGFQAIAEAIRKSTVSLQYLQKDQRKYEVRYGVAQALQTKSKTKGDLAAYIGEFVSLYNAETSRKAETFRKAEEEDRAFRKNVRDDKLTLFYGLLDKYPSKLVGAMLASYGFALPKKVKSDDEEDTIYDEQE